MPGLHTVENRLVCWRIICCWQLSIQSGYCVLSTKEASKSYPKKPSTSRERRALLQRFIGQFGKSRIKGLLADREFIGDTWMGWLIQERIPFNIRIRNNNISPNRRGQKTRVDRLSSQQAYWIKLRAINKAINGYLRYHALSRDLIATPEKHLQ